MKTTIEILSIFFSPFTLYFHSFIIDQSIFPPVWLIFSLVIFSTLSPVLALDSALIPLTLTLQPCLYFSPLLCFRHLFLILISSL